MKNFLRLIAVAMFFIVPATQASAERVLRLNEVPIGELDPHKALDYIDSMLLFNIYDTLVWPKAGGGFEGILADSWDTSSDGKVLTMTLRDGVKFHDGSTVNADDVVYSFERAAALGQGYAYLYADATISKVSDNQVRFTLPSPNSTFLPSLVRLGIVNSDLVKANQKSGDFGANGDYGQAFLSATDAGSSAYMVVSHAMQELTVLSKFDAFHKGFNPKAPDTIRVRYITDTATIRTLMVKGEHELTMQWHPNEMFKALDEAEGVGLTSEQGVGYLVMPINTQKAPTDDVHFRRAIVLAVDYASMLIIEKVSDSLTAAAPARTAIPSALFSYDRTMPAFKQDLEAARAELALSVYADRLDEFEIELAWVAAVPKEEKIALLLQQNLAQIGIKSRVVKMPWVVFADSASTIETTPHVGQLYFSATWPDPLSLLGDYSSTTSGTYLSMHWLNDAKVDELIAQATAEFDDSKKEALLKELQHRIVDLAPAIYAYETRALFAKADYVSAPSLDDPRNTVAVMGGNFKFHMWAVDREN